MEKTRSTQAKLLFYLSEDFQREHPITGDLPDRFPEEFVMYAEFVPRMGDDVCFEPEEMCPFLDGCGRYKVVDVSITYDSNGYVKHFFVNLELA